MAATRSNDPLDFINQLEIELNVLFGIVKNKAVKDLLLSLELSSEDIHALEQTADYQSLPATAKDKYDALFSVALEMVALRSGNDIEEDEFRKIMRVRLLTIRDFSYLGFWRNKKSEVEVKAEEIIEKLFKITAEESKQNLVILPKSL